MFFWETATLIDIMLLGHWLEMRSVLGASRALEELVRLLPVEAHRLRSDGSTEDVPLTALKAGDLVLVKPGEKIPTDGTITEGRTTVNQALLTGESQPVEKGPGDAVLGGAVNGESAIPVRVTRTGAVSARRVAYALGHGCEIPAGIRIAVTCGVKRCMNPAHLVARLPAAPRATPPPTWFSSK